MIGAVGVARSLRRSLVVTSEGLIVRRLCTTERIAWDELSLRSHPQRRFPSTRVHGIGGLRSSVDENEQEAFRDAVHSASARPPTSWGPHLNPTHVVMHWMPWVLVLSVYGLLAGQAVIASDTPIQAAYLARASREETTTALVVGSWIASDGPHARRYTSYAAIRFAHRGRTITTVIHRPGRTRLSTETEVSIVYDSAHPRDADHGDRVNRKADAQRVDDEVAAAWRGSAIGAAGLAVVAACSWRRQHHRRRDMRSSNPRPEVRA
jgi:hypothetical protein